MKTEWKNVETVASFLEKRFGKAPKVLVVLGSGLGGVADALEKPITMGFDEVPMWPGTTVKGHAGMLKYGDLAGQKVMLQMGRVHLYEGNSAHQVVRPVRAALEWGVKLVVLTNAAGGIDETLRVGNLMMLEDHINLTGHNPLVGENLDRVGERFPDMTEVYDRGIRAVALHRASELGINLRTGVYAGLMGPSYETPAEVKMLASLGADAVGMSTVLEAIAARHMGASIVGISCITNQAASNRGSVLSHDEVQVFAAKAADDLVRILAAIIDVPTSSGDVP